MLEIKDDTTVQLSQIESDNLLAWKLQAEEHKLAYQGIPRSESLLSSQNSTPELYQFQSQNEVISFTLKETKGDGDCFFHAVGIENFTRQALVEKLLQNTTEAVRRTFGYEIRQFLYLGFSGFHPGRENEACQRLLSSDIRERFLTLQKAEEKLRVKVDKVRLALGKKETHGKRPRELLTLLSEKNSVLRVEFEQAYQPVLKADNAIYQYCCQEDIFKNYVKFYLQDARGYIPFSRDFGREIPTTTIDVINQLFGLKIQVYLPPNRGGTQLQLANLLQAGESIPIFYNGINHFCRLEKRKLLFKALPAKLNLIEAIKQNNEAEFFKLLNLKTDCFGKRIIDEVDMEQGGNALHMALACGHLHFIVPLIEAGIDVNQLDNDDWSPVYIAAEQGYAEIVTILKAAGADVDIPNSDGTIPVYVAIENGHKAALIALERAGANIDSPNSDGFTPICIAAQMGDVAIIKILLEAGADASIKTSLGAPLEQAKKGKESGCPEIVTLLKAHLKQYPSGIKPGTSKVGILPIESNRQEKQENSSVFVHFSEENISKRRGSEQLNLADKKEEKEKIRYVLEELRNFFLEDREEGARTENYVIYNECLKKANADAQLVYSLKQKKHILYVNNEPVDTKTAAEELLKMLRSLVAVASIPDKPTAFTATVNIMPLKTTLQVACPPPMLPQFQGFIKPSLQKASGVKIAVSLIEAIKQNNGQEFHRLLALDSLQINSFGKKTIDEVDTEYESSTLSWAADCGYMHFIDPLIKAGADFEKPSKDGGTPVLYAASKGYVEVITALNKVGANINKKNECGVTPVCIAAANGHASAIIALHAAGADVNTPMNDGTTPVYAAAANGHASAIITLHAAGADVNTPMNDGTTPVYAAAINGHASAIIALHAAGANLNMPNIPNGNTTLVYAAAQKGHVAAVAALKAVGASMNKLEFSRTLVYNAAQNGNASVISALHAAGANVNMSSKEGKTPVYIAAENGHASAIAALGAAGANVDKPAPNDTTPVYIAADKGHASAIAALRAAGANVNNSNRNQETPIFIAAKKGHMAAIAALHAAKAEVDMPNKDGWTPVHATVFNKSEGHVATIAALHDANANVNMQDNDGYTPIYVAALIGNAVAIAALHAAGGDVNMPSKEGKTPVYIATENGHASAIKALLKAGANANASFKEPSSWIYMTSPLQLAKQSQKAEHQKIVSLLQAHLKKYPDGAQKKVNAKVD